MAQTATVQITMPEMGESVTEGIVLEWHVAEGDFVNEGDTIVEVSTDKVDAEVPAPASGTITKLLVAVDDEVPAGSAMAEMEEGTDGAPAAGPAAAGDPPPLPVAKASSGGVPPTVPPAARTAAENGNGSGGRVKASPLARRIASEVGVDIGALAGSGPGGRIVKKDVEAAQGAPA